MSQRGTLPHNEPPNNEAPDSSNDVEQPPHHNGDASKPSPLQELEATRLEGANVEEVLSHNGLVAVGVEVPDSQEGPLGSPLETSTELVHAKPIQQQENDFIPQAVEVDPEAKPPIYKQRLLLWILLLGIFLLIVMVLLLVFLLDSDNDKQHRQGFHEAIQAQLNVTFEDSERAMEWFLTQDQSELSIDDPNLVQRYLLAVFYFNLHQTEHMWLSCDADPQNDFCIYKKLARVVPQHGYDSISRKRWLSASNECLWGGVVCDEFDVVTEINLSGQNIIGSLPTVLAHLPSLQVIDLDWNQLTGTIPSEYGNMPNLHSLRLHYNQLSGTLPESWSNATSLRDLVLGDNQDISGTLPHDIAQMTQLRGLSIFNTNIRGQLHTQIVNLSSLRKYHLCDYSPTLPAAHSFAQESLRVGYTHISGTLPTEIGQMPLLEIWAEHSLVGGTLPSEIGLVTGLRSLLLHQAEIQGTIPEELWNLGTSLVTFYAFGTNVNGTLSQNVAKASRLQRLRLSDTSMNGPLPTELASLTGLKSLWLQGTEFTGQVPPGLCDLRGENGLSQLLANCLPPSDGGELPITCQCCSQCCRSDGVCDP